MFVDAAPPRRSSEANTKIGAGNDAEADIVIGLVNIMPVAAMRTIENLFRCLLEACASPHKIRLRLFTLRSGSGQTTEILEPPQYYEGLDELWDSPDSEFPLDALIVTGTESRAKLMKDELCWPDLQKICDWAGENTISTLWSCFSAHAAALHIDNIHREPLSEKLSGIFECEKASNHPIFKNMPAQWVAPHSRYNNLNEADLESSGYEILSRSPGIGADSFIKQYKKSQFLFLQGHLEYGSEMLFSEYCRDLKRFSLGQSATRPQFPKNYFDQPAIDAFASLETSLPASPDALSAADFVAAVTTRLNNNWQTPAQQLYTSWLSYIAAQKTDASRNAALLSAQFSAGSFKVSHPSETRGHIAQP